MFAAWSEHEIQAAPADGELERRNGKRGVRVQVIFEVIHRRAVADGVEENRRDARAEQDEPRLIFQQVGHVMFQRSLLRDRLDPFARPRKGKPEKNHGHHREHAGGPLPAALQVRRGAAHFAERASQRFSGGEHHQAAAESEDETKRRQRGAFLAIRRHHAQMIALGDVGDDGDIAAIEAESGAENAAARRLQHGRLDARIAQDRRGRSSGPLQSPASMRWPSM